MAMRIRLPYLRAAIFAVSIILVVSRPALPQTRQLFSEEAARYLVRAALLQYFDPASVFEISPSGAALSGEVLVVDELVIEGKPAVLRGFRWELLAQFSGLQLDVTSLASQQVKIAGVGRATVVARSTAKDVQDGLVRMSARILGPTVKFQIGQFEVVATIRRGEKLYPAQARGNLLVEQGQRVRVTVTQAQVFGSEVPPGLIEGELAKVNPILDLSRWPLNLQIQRLVLHNDRIELLATSGK